jgi:type I restriction enzyme S subunit
MSEGREIPNGWVWGKLGDVSIFFQGYGFPKKLQGQTAGEYPFYKVGDISKNVKAGNTYLEFCENHINEDILKKLKAKTSPRNTIVFAKIGEALKLNRRALIKQPSIVDNNAIGLKADGNICNDFFLFYFLNCLKLENYSRATTVPSVRKTDIEAVKIPIPPLPEQHRIVAKIEELFSSLDKGIESLKTAQQQLKIYRQAVLKWAFEGRLTNKNVVEGELPKGWKWVRLDTVCNKIQDGSHFSPKIQYDEPEENRFLYITAKNIRNNYMDLSKVTYIDREFHESIYGRCNPEYGDVLLTKDGVNTGEVTLNSLKEEFSLLSSVCIFKTKSNELDSGFLKYFIQSPLGSRAVSDSMTGTAIKRIILRKIKDAEIIQPPLREQYAIVAEIESRLSVCDKIEESIEHSLKQSESLRQSILKKAFEGKLVPQDPNDEPASVLLDRIKSEREKDRLQHERTTMRKRDAFPLSPRGRGRG